MKTFHDSSLDSSVGFLKIHINDEKFVLDKVGGAAPSLAGGFLMAQASLSPNQACYALIKHAADEHKWIFVNFVPDLSAVRDKMLYASSRSALKDGLGSQSFVGDYFITTAAECTLEGFEHAKKMDHGDDLLTWDEKVKKNAHSESVKSVGSVKIAAIADIPINVSEDAVSCVNQFNSGEYSAVYFDLNQETEVLQAHGEAKATPETVAKKLMPQDPRYALFRFSHDYKSETHTEHKDSNVFIYYCPDLAIPRAKLFYSAAKSMVLRVLTELKVDIAKNIEISDAKELTAKDLMDELYPKSSAKKTFSKPKRQGKGKARLHKATDAPPPS